MSNIERRRHKRKCIEDSALIHVNTKKGSVEKIGRVENISVGGVCFSNLKTLGGFTSEADLEGGQAAVYFRSMPVSVFGTVARHDAFGRLVVKVRQSTDENIWENINN